MGMVKEKFTEYEIGLESMEAGLKWMTQYGVKPSRTSLVSGSRSAVPNSPTSLKSMRLLFHI